MMNHRYRFSRANTIPETALCISLVMVTLFGVIEYAITGFNQIGADGAAFVGDHSTVAEYSGNPTIAQGNSYGKQVGQTSFAHSSGYNASVPKNYTFEMDLGSTTQLPGAGVLSLFPSTVATRSRIIEPASTSVTTTPPGQCAKFVNHITFNGNQILSSTGALVSSFPAVGAGINGAATAARPLFTAVTDASGHQAISYAAGQLAATTQLAALQGVSDNLTLTATGLANIGSILAPFGPTGASIAQGISAQIAPLLNSAVGGTYTATAGGTITVTTPLTSAQFAAQVTASTNAIGTIEKSNLVSGLLSTVLTQTINPLLYGSTVNGIPLPGVLTGGPNGGFLTQMNNAENALYALNLKVPSC